LAKYLSKLGKKFWLKKPKVEIEERLTPVLSEKPPIRRVKPVTPFQMPNIPKEIEERAKRAFDAIMNKGDYVKATLILEGKEPKRFEVPIAKSRKIPLGLIQAYIRAKLEGWLLDEYDLGRFIEKSAQIWRVKEERIREWIKQIDDALITTQISLRFIYGYIIAKRKGLIEQFVKQQAEEFNTTEEQITQITDEVKKCLRG
jgi:hypothetical protein